MAIAPELMEAGEAGGNGEGYVAGARQRLKASGFGPRTSQLRRKVADASAAGGSASEKRAMASAGTESEGAYRARQAGRAASRAASATSSAAGRASRATGLTPQAAFRSPSGFVTRLIIAGAVFIIALEVVSEITGKYFTWNLKQGSQNLQNAAGYVGLYPGQKEKLAQAAAPATPAAAPTLAQAVPNYTHTGGTRSA